MKRVILVFASGLSRRFLTSEAMPWLSAAQDPRHVSELAPTFPSLPEVVSYCALSGQLPAVHGCVLTRDLTRAPHEKFEPQLRVVAEGQLLEQARAHGLSSDQRREAAAALDEQLRELFEAREENDLLLVAGLCDAQPVDERIAWESLPRDADCRFAAESAILQVRVSKSSSLSRVGEALLRTRGVERVLHGDALTAFGVDEEAGTQLLALAREGFSFEEERAAVGNPRGTAEEESVLVALGSSARTSWPATLHALRLAPSLARYWGRPESGYADRPFAL